MYENCTVFSFFNLYYVHNFGVAFGFLSNHSNTSWRCFFIFITVLTILIFLRKVHCEKNEKKINHLAYILIVSGALGNLTDRLTHGFVIDMIDFHIKNWHFATFNIADVSIFIGVLFSMLVAILPSNK